MIAVTETVFMCGECMNSAEFRTRVIVPRDGRCDCCGRDDNGKVWELGGVTYPPPHGPKQAGLGVGEREG